MANQPKNKNILRLVDANLNRCREGCRVLEDTARFVWSDAALYENFRSKRHQLDKLTRKLYPELVQSRNSAEDHGRKIKEGSRARQKDIVYANFRRCEESLRVLEEYGKLFSAKSGAAFKRLRYEMYDLEKNGCRS